MLPFPDVTMGAVGGILLIIIPFAIALGFVARASGRRLVSYIFYFTALACGIAVISIIFILSGQH